MTGPGGLSYDANNNRLFVADGFARRVTMFMAGPSVIANGHNASNVLGQPSFTSCFNSNGQAGVILSNGTAVMSPAVVYDPGSGRIFVADTDNNRILIFEGSYMGSYQWLPGYD